MASNEIANTQEGGLPEVLDSEKAKGVSQGHGQDRAGKKAQDLRERRPRQAPGIASIAKGSLVNMSRMLTSGSGDMTQKDANSLMDPLSDLGAATSTLTMSFGAGWAMGMDSDKKIQSMKDTLGSYKRDAGYTKGKGVNGEYDQSQEESHKHGKNNRRQTRAAMGSMAKKAGAIAAVGAAIYGAHAYMSSDTETPQMSTENLQDKILNTATLGQDNLAARNFRNPAQSRGMAIPSSHNEMDM